MANVADANVRIVAQRCAKEVKDWLEAVDAKAYYNICDDHEGYERPDLGENSRDFAGVASGRWTYETNISRALSTKKDERTTWCGNEDAERAYQALIKKLEQDHEATVSIDYEEAECGLAFMGKGVVEIYYNEEDGEVGTYMNYEGDDLTVENLIAYGFADTVKEAKEYMGIEE